MSDPLVSVILATHQGGHYLESAVNSVLSQTYENFELLLVDDASTDGSVRPFLSHADPRLRVITNQENIGQTRSLNIGIASARGQFIARIDSDDICMPERLSLQVAAMTKYPETVIIGGQALIIDPNNKLIGRSKMPCLPNSVRAFSFLHNPFIHSTVMLRRDVLISNGFVYDPDYAIQDFDLWTRILQRYVGRNLDQFVIKYRVHDGSMTQRNYERNIIENEKIISRNFVNLGLTHSYDKPKVEAMLRYFFQDRSVARAAGVSRVSLSYEYLRLLLEINSIVPFSNEMKRLSLERLLKSGVWPEGLNEMGARAKLFLKLFYIWPIETTYLLGKFFIDFFKKNDPKIQQKLLVGVKKYDQ